MGCATQPQMVWMRLDGKPASGDPAQVQQFQLAQIQCRGEAATVTANAPQPAYPSIYLLAAAQGQRNQTIDAVMQACMSKAGYVWTADPRAVQ